MIRDRSTWRRSKILSLSLRSLIHFMSTPVTLLVTALNFQTHVITGGISRWSSERERDTLLNLWCRTSRIIWMLLWSRPRSTLFLLFTKKDHFNCKQRVCVSFFSFIHKKVMRRNMSRVITHRKIWEKRKTFRGWIQTLIGSEQHLSHHHLQ